MIRVLVVDDQEENLYFLTALLRAHGYEVVTARHGGEALTEAARQRPDLIIADLLMPVMDGYTLLRSCKSDESLRTIPFVVYTATYTDPEDERLALQLGAAAFIVKPAEPDVLMTRLREVLRAVASVSPSDEFVVDEAEQLRDYNHVLVRKLEKKMLQLDDVNRSLQREIVQQQRLADTQVAILDALPAHIALIDSAGVICAVNESWRRFAMANTLVSEACGIGTNYLTVCEQTVGEGADEAIHAADGIRRVLKGQTKEFSLEYPCHSPTERRWFRLMVTPVRDARLGGAAVMHVDVTERKRAEDELAQQAALLDRARDAIVVRDVHQRVTYWNQSAEHLYGWRAAEALGQPFDELVGVDPERYRAADEAVRRIGEWSGELQAMSKDGATRTFEYSWTLLRDPQQRPRAILTIGTDVTERKQLEQQFLRAQRLESIGTLAGGIAHDLNNVLAPILMGIGYLKMDETNAERLETLNTIEASAERGADMVRQVLSFARGVEGRRLEVPIGQVVRDVEKMANETFLKGIRVEAVVPPDVWAVIGDVTQLHQVLVNLCVNARDAMPRGGRLRMTVQNLLVDEHYADLAIEATPGPYVLIQVDDTGSGMPKAVIDRIFEPFFTTKETGKGTGLGLSTSLAIVKSHAGFMRVYSEPGRGTTFKIYLPALVSTGPSHGEVVVDEQPRGRNELVLVIDDEDAVRRITQRTLEAHGYRVLLAIDGADGVAKFAGRKGEVAAVITDMMMPVMDGPATIQVLRKLSPAVRIIAASGLNAEGRSLQAAALGVTHVLSKPYTSGALLRELRSVIDAPA